MKLFRTSHPLNSGYPLLCSFVSLQMFSVLLTVADDSNYGAVDTRFDTLDEAIAYARKLDYAEVIGPDGYDDLRWVTETS